MTGLTRSIKTKIIQGLKPTTAYEKNERKFILSVIKRIKKEIPKTKVILAGSFAKGTFLNDDKDIDIFVLFKHNQKEEKMKKLVFAAVKNTFPNAIFKIAYAQHPYVRILSEGRKIDVVPGYEVSKISSKFKSAVDRSLLHCKYILSKMSKKQKDEVRLLKKFLKINFLYGAEIKVQGFSGYLCELLILRYGTFEKTMDAIAKWKEHTLIDLRNKKGEDGVKKREALAKFKTPLIVIDPIDANRNVSANVSKESYNAIIACARAFLRSNDELAFFTERTLTDLQLTDFLKTKNIYCISFAAPNIVDDVLWGQIRRFYSALRTAMEKEGFKIIGYKMDKLNNKVYILLELFKDKLSQTKILQGPPLKFAGECKKFSFKYKNVFIKNARLVAKIKRHARTFEEFFSMKINEISLPSHLNSAKNAKIYRNAKIIKYCKEVLQQYFLWNIYSVFSRFWAREDSNL
ncbi:MAG: CCA tRNA nucleotidyltransferase [Candidatus Micrarchaeota archaeon]